MRARWRRSPRHSATEYLSPESSRLSTERLPWHRTPVESSRIHEVKRLRLALARFLATLGPDPVDRGRDRCAAVSVSMLLAIGTATAQSNPASFISTFMSVITIMMSPATTTAHPMVRSTIDRTIKSHIDPQHSQLPRLYPISPHSARVSRAPVQGATASRNAANKSFGTEASSLPPTPAPHRSDHLPMS